MKYIVEELQKKTNWISGTREEEDIIIRIVILAIFGCFQHTHTHRCPENTYWHVERKPFYPLSLSLSLFLSDDL